MTLPESQLQLDDLFAEMMQHLDCAACEFNDAKTGSRRWQRCAGCYGDCNFKRRQP